LTDLLRSKNGVNARLSLIRKEAMLDRTDAPDPVVQALNAGVDMEDKATGTKYPQILVHLGKVRNLLTEKYRKFSGVAELVVEVRVSHDRLDMLDRATLVYTDSVVGVLEDCRGEWGDCVFYSGRYEIDYGPVRRGGRHFVQTTRISAPVEVSLG
jgi:hypothetical protein